MADVCMLTLRSAFEACITEPVWSFSGDILCAGFKTRTDSRQVVVHCVVSLFFFFRLKEKFFSLMFCVDLQYVNKKKKTGTILKVFAVCVWAGNCNRNPETQQKLWDHATELFAVFQGSCYRNCGMKVVVNPIKIYKIVKLFFYFLSGDW